MKSTAIIAAFTLVLGSSAAIAQADEFAGKQNLRSGTPIANPLATLSYTGNSTGGPTWARPIANSATDCGTTLSGVGSATPYSVQEFNVSLTGNYDVSSVQPTFDGYIFVYRENFNPAQPFVNCVGGDDDGPGGIGTSEMLAVPLDANVSYFVVTTGFGNTDFGAFTNTINGPGNIALGAPAANLIAVNALSPWSVLALVLMLGLAGTVVLRRYS